MDFVLKFLLEHQTAATQSQEFLIFSRYHSNLRDQMKTLIIFFLLFIIMIFGWLLSLLKAFVTSSLMAIKSLLQA